jgi:hypothetical protein
MKDRPAKAMRSPGKKARGRRVAARNLHRRFNALKHGLTRPIAADSALSSEINELVALYAGEHPDQHREYFSRRAAEAQLDLF